MEALEMEEWDIVTFNQGSVQSGRPFTYYPFINELFDIVVKHSPKVKPYIYQTWAYECDAEHPYFPVYNNDQKEMHIRARDSYKLAASLLNAPIIPVGDVIQYLRENVPEFDYKNGGLIFTKSAREVEDIIKVCEECGVSCNSGTIFETDADNIRNVVKVCQKHGIKYSDGGMIFRHDPFEIEKVVAVCKEEGINYQDGGNIFRRTKH